MVRKLMLMTLASLFLCGVGYCESPFNVDCFFGWDGCYRPMQWMPVNVRVDSSLTEPFEGVLSITAQQDGLNNLVINHEFVLTPGVRLNIPLVTKLAYNANECAVRIVNRQGKTVWSKKYDLWDYSMQKGIMNSISENDLLIGMAGKRSFGILKLETETACQYGQSLGKVYVKDKRLSQLPWDWTGYCGLDVLVLYDADLSQCNVSQLEAMSQWVQNGGKVLIIMSSNPLLETNPLRRCLPFEMLASGDRKLTSLDTDALKLDWGSGQNVVAWPVKMNDLMMCDFVATDSETCLFACGYSGYGRIGVLSFDPSQLKSVADSKGFWIHTLSSILADPVVKENCPEFPKKQDEDSYNHYEIQYELHKIQLTSCRDIVEKVEVDEDEDDYHYYSRRYAIGLEQAGSNSVMEYLLNIPQMRPLSIWWVIMLLVLLAVLLGPVDYIVLKRMDRQPLTWLTCTFWIVVFTVGSYYGVQALRSGELQYRSVTVTDSIDHDDSIWSVTHAGVFAPKSDEYRFDGVGQGQWWSAISPEQRELYGYNRQNASRNVYCGQYDGSNVPYSIPVNIWTMQCLLCEEPKDEFPVRAVVRHHNHQVSLEITNLSNTTIEKGYVLLKDNWVFEFEGLESLETKEYSGQAKITEVWKHDSGNYRETFKFIQPLLNNEEAYLAKGSLDRTKSIMAMVERGAAVVCVEMNTDETPIRVKDKDCIYTNRKLYRLLVYPEEL